MNKPFLVLPILYGTKAHVLPFDVLGIAAYTLVQSMSQGVFGVGSLPM